MISKDDISKKLLLKREPIEVTKMREHILSSYITY